jgi:anti-sigma-K factor RskA
MAEDDLPEVLAGEYVLGVLDAAERAAFELRMVREPALARLVEEWQARLLPLDEGLAPVEPRPEVWRRIAQSIQPRRFPQHRAWWNRLALWRGWALAATAAAFGLLVLLGVERAPTPQLVAVLNDSNGQPLWIVSAGADASRLVARPLGAPDGQAQVPELWLLPRDGRPPVSLGVLDRQGNNRRSLPTQAQALLEPGAGLAVSLEPPGGSPTGQPTGPVVSSGALLTQPF